MDSSLIWNHVIIFIVTLGCCFLNSEASSDGIHHRQKREVRYCKDKFKILRTHSACRPRSSAVKETGVNATEIQVILREHNKYRGMANLSATNMMKLTWDPEVAEVAQTWAETCSFGHDKNEDRRIPGRFSVGQNIGKGYTNWPDCIRAWYDEVNNFTYNTNNNFHEVGHYTQLVWATTTKIGCGWVRCETIEFHVCDYAPAGNIGHINVPYERGTPICNSTLCDCAGKTCENGGILHPGNCSCTCKYPEFQVGEECKLECANLTEPWQCGTGSYDKEGCNKFSNTVPSECPLVCDTCPYAGKSYKEVGIKLPENAGTRTSSCDVIAALIVSFLIRCLNY